jgi:sensor c-di-GMP phosphodiesterase-like protein
MTSIRSNSAVLLMSLVALFGAVQIATASEVSGTLSSDGSSDVGQSSVMSETNTTQNVDLRQAAPQDNGQLQGSVVGGREESAALASAENTASLSSAVWLTIAAGIALGTVVYFLWRRRVT